MVECVLSGGHGKEPPKPVYYIHLTEEGRVPIDTSLVVFSSCGFP